jgi:hypothetical protein
VNNLTIINAVIIAQSDHGAGIGSGNAEAGDSAAYSTVTNLTIVGSVANVTSSSGSGYAIAGPAASESLLNNLTKIKSVINSDSGGSGIG